MHSWILQCDVIVLMLLNVNLIVLINFLKAVIILVYKNSIQTLIKIHCYVSPWFQSIRYIYFERNTCSNLLQNIYNIRQTGLFWYPPSNYQSLRYWMFHRPCLFPPRLKMKIQRTFTSHSELLISMSTIFKFSSTTFMFFYDAMVFTEVLIAFVGLRLI